MDICFCTRAYLWICQSLFFSGNACDVYSYMLYLTVLSNVDIFVLYTVCRYLKHGNSILEQYQTLLWNKRFPCFICVEYCVVDLIAVTVKRCMVHVVCSPFKRRSYATIERAILTTFIKILVAIAMNDQILWTAALVDENTCLSEYGFVLYAWPWVDLFKHSFILFVVILTTKILIVRLLICSNRRINTGTRSNAVHTISGDENSHASTQRHTCTMHISSITAILLVISIAFCLLTSPLPRTLWKVHQGWLCSAL